MDSTVSIIMWVVLAIIVLGGIGVLIYYSTIGKTSFTTSPYCSTVPTQWGPMKTCAGAIPKYGLVDYGWKMSSFTDCQRQLILDQPSDAFTYDIGRYDMATGMCYPGITPAGITQRWEPNPTGMGYRFIDPPGSRA